ncbi:DUF1254 domain-containing protein [Motilimonas pumila]|uniref:DUF1254 domain-containing protein n=1 Tax=Motilimonas pumila TaxID=2303987 RepID=A0A418YFS4_9GAMM|nr:DUF1254 domain-containing protein [Motilimonas pumila]RJG48394.1 DUF1254 domain-containing protein [Motilimonas pumila]
MNKTLIATLLAGCSGLAIAQPFDAINPIDSSNWDINPQDYGMTAEQFIESESLHFMKNMAQREGINGIFHFTTLAKAEDRWVVSPYNGVVYSMVVVDVSEGFTLTLPNTGECYITTQIVSQEHISSQLMGGGTYTYDGSECKGTHVVIGI